ncbi:hypothetical protein ACNF49_21820 [Actinomadura sp. ATCC 39365]|uniref:hypothetical protein n=1 Tax=Nonomuraea sp. NPDC005692 TaxID=3157168 RepID=UPI0033BFC264
MGGRARRRHGDAPRRPSRTAVLLSGGTMLCSIASNFGQAPERAHHIAAASYR